MRLSEAVDFGSNLISRRDTVHVLQSVTGCSREDILIRGDIEIGKNLVAEFRQKIRRAADGEPLQYVLGKWDFCGTPFIVDNRALIPRPETELLVEAVINYVGSRRGSPDSHGTDSKVRASPAPTEKERLDILDVCAGGGCIGLSIAKLTGFWHNVTLADISEDALALARENSLRIHPNITLIQSDLLDNVHGEFDIIVSNPPYIKGGDMESLPENVKNYEPHLALDGGPDGLGIYRRLIPQCLTKLKPGGKLILEIGPTDAMEIMQNTGFMDIEIQKDYAGIDRILEGVKNHV